MKLEILLYPYCFKMCIRDSVVTLGKFDGLHRGHMLLIRRVLAIGRTERLETVVFTFDVPPQSKVQHVKPHQLLTNEERRARLEQLGMDCLVECPFVDEVMHMTPEAFIKEILVDKLHAKKVVVGKDFGFGYKRSGTAEMLKEMGPSLGFETEIIEKAEENGRETVSYTHLDVYKRQIRMSMQSAHASV